MDAKKSLINEIEPNTVIDGLYKGEKIIKKIDGYYINDIRLSPANYKKIDRTEDTIPASSQSKFSSIAKTILGTITFTMPLLAKSAKEDAENVLMFAKINWNDDSESKLFMQETVFNEIIGYSDFFDFSINTSIKFSEFTEKTALKNKLDALKPFFKEDYQSDTYCLPSIIKIVDGVVRENEPLCDGAIGWREIHNNLEILCLYKSFVPESGLLFLPTPQINAVYYENPHKPNQYIIVDSIFDEVQNSRAAELEQIASDLGAKYFRIEMVDTRFESNKLNAESGISALADFYSVDSKLKLNKQESNGHYLFTESNFSRKRKPCKPELKWFANNDKIKSLIDIRLGDGGNKLKSHDVVINCVNHSIFSFETADKLSAIIKYVDVNAGTSFKDRYENERNQVMIFHVEF